LGNALLLSSKGDLVSLKGLAQKTSLLYQRTADKFAEELLQCGRDYFSENRNDNTIKLGTAMKLLARAKSTAYTKELRDRIEESVISMQEWIDTKPQRDKQAQCQPQVDFIKRQLDTLASACASTSQTKACLENCLPKLVRIKDTLGQTDSLYMDISSAILTVALGKVIEIVNRGPDSHVNASQTDRAYALARMKLELSEIATIVNQLQSMDAHPDAKAWLSQNISTLNGIIAEVNSLSGSVSSSSNSGCYIATMAYGDHEHPQVRILRQYRDRVLLTQRIGRVLVGIYYWFSPKLVTAFRDCPRANSAIRYLLNSFIKQIRLP
jgi:hypothetical protein